MFRSEKMGRFAAVALCATLSLCSLKASAESYASSMNSSASGGIGAQGGENQSGGVLGGMHNNETINPQLNQNSQSGGPSTGNSEAGSVSDRSIKVDNPLPPGSKDVTSTGNPTVAQPDASAGRAPASGAQGHSRRTVFNPPKASERAQETTNNGGTANNGHSYATVGNAPKSGTHPSGPGSVSATGEPSANNGHSYATVGNAPHTQAAATTRSASAPAMRISSYRARRSAGKQITIRSIRRESKSHTFANKTSHNM